MQMRKFLKFKTYAFFSSKGFGVEWGDVGIEMTAFMPTNLARRSMQKIVTKSKSVP
jgi:hypothetical protein